MVDSDESDKKSLVQTGGSSIVEKTNEASPSLAGIELGSSPADLFVHFKNTLDMTPEARQALVDVETKRTEAAVAQAQALEAQAHATADAAKSRYEIPAKEDSKKHYASWAGAAAFGGGALYAAVHQILSPQLAVVFVSIVGIFKLTEFARDRSDKKKDE